MSTNPNLKCRFCGDEKNLTEVQEFSWSIITCRNCIHKLPSIPMGKYNIKNRIINYFKRRKRNFKF
jgi:hypothetical protein